MARQDPPGHDTPSAQRLPRAQHGGSSEVRWRSGQGRQPYANRGTEEAREPNLGDECEGGDRGERSGTTLEQMRQLRQKP
jgi:hypothetical protein